MKKKLLIKVSIHREYTHLEMSGTDLVATQTHLCSAARDHTCTLVTVGFVQLVCCVSVLP